MRLKQTPVCDSSILAERLQTIVVLSIGFCSGRLATKEELTGHVECRRRQGLVFGSLLEEQKCLRHRGFVLLPCR